MERNTILAFVLCLVVLIIWFVMSPKQQDKVPVVEELQGKQETAKTESSERAIPQPPITPEVERGELKKEILSCHI